MRACGMQDGLRWVATGDMHAIAAWGTGAVGHLDGPGLDLRSAFSGEDLPLTVASPRGDPTLPHQALAGISAVPIFSDDATARGGTAAGALHDGVVEGDDSLELGCSLRCVQAAYICTACPGRPAPKWCRSRFLQRAAFSPPWCHWIPALERGCSAQAPWAPQ